MPRTTLDLDAGVMRELKRRKRESGQSIGQLASELLASAMREPRREGQPLRWRAASMGARIDLDDKEAVRRTMDGA